jgi:hypothetical protein
VLVDESGAAADERRRSFDDAASRLARREVSASADERDVQLRRARDFGRASRGAEGDRAQRAATVAR